MDNSRSSGVGDRSDQRSIQSLITIISQEILFVQTQYVSIHAADWLMLTVIRLYSTVTGNNLLNILCDLSCGSYEGCSMGSR
jgi:hypothetical protein